MSYIGNTYLHLLASLAIVLISMNNSFIHGGIYYLLAFLIVFAILFFLIQMPVGPFKYVVFTIFLVLIGQITAPLTKQLKEKGIYYDVLASVTGIFVAMTAVGFYTKDKFLPFGTTFIAGLIGLIIARVVLIIMGLSGSKTDTISNILSWFATVLFAGFVAFDTQMMKKRLFKKDYINSSLGLFLDILNLYSSVGDIMD